MKNLYEVLGVEKNASNEDIKKSFHKLALQFHPDRNPGDKDAEEKFKEISAAYEVLSSPEKRAAYDANGTTNPRTSYSGGGMDPWDFIMRNMGNAGGGFGDIFGKRSQRQATTGDDIQKDIQITFMDAALGAAKTISVDYPLPCKTCNGTGAKDGTHLEPCATCGEQGQIGHTQGFMRIMRTCPQCRGRGKTITMPCADCTNGIKVKNETIKVTVPAGISDGNILKLAGKGMPSPYGYDPGDMFLRISVQPHAKFKRDGLTIFIEETIDYLDAILGIKIDIDTIHGSVKLKVPPGTQPGSILKVKEQGIILGDKSKGDHLVGVKVRVPDKLTTEEKELLEKLKSIRQ